MSEDGGSVAAGAGPGEAGGWGGERENGVLLTRLVQERWGWPRGWIGPFCVCPSTSRHPTAVVIEEAVEFRQAVLDKEAVPSSTENWPPSLQKSDPIPLLLGVV